MDFGTDPQVDPHGKTTRKDESVPGRNFLPGIAVFVDSLFHISHVAVIFRKSNSKGKILLPYGICFCKIILLHLLQKFYAGFAVYNEVL